MESNPCPVLPTLPLPPAEPHPCDTSVLANALRRARMMEDARRSRASLRPPLRPPAAWNSYCP